MVSMATCHTFALSLSQNIHSFISFICATSISHLKCGIAMTRDLAPSHDGEVMNSFRHKFIDSMCKSENVQNEALNAHVWALH